MPLVLREASGLWWELEARGYPHQVSISLGGTPGSKMPLQLLGTQAKARLYHFGTLFHRQLFRADHSLLEITQLRMGIDLSQYYQGWFRLSESSRNRNVEVWFFQGFLSGLSPSLHAPDCKPGVCRRLNIAWQKWAPLFPEGSPRSVNVNVFKSKKRKMTSPDSAGPGSRMACFIL